MTKGFIFTIFTAFLASWSLQAQESAGFVTLLGHDTMVLESFTFTDHMVEAEVVVRTPRTTYRKYRITYDQDFKAREYWTATYDPKVSLEDPTTQSKGIFDDDMVRISTIRDDVENLREVEAASNTLLFVDMVHWPYELVFKKMAKLGITETDQPLLTGRRVGTFVFKNMDGKGSIKHPSRGTMTAVLSEMGQLVELDAGATTRKLKVTRTESIEIRDFVKYFTALDEMGKGVGALSGAAEFDGKVQGATIHITHGQPVRRGRDLFGGIVPWNQRWRTGANRATHFTTDRDLQMGELLVPAGEYTLFTIPAADGGTLIINKQTGQNGRSYDESMDLGRVKMSIGSVDENVELFTIQTVEMGKKGVLQLIWGQTKFEISFAVKD